jgi:iron complex transport system substrate-binding protein
MPRFRKSTSLRFTIAAIAVAAMLAIGCESRDRAAKQPIAHRGGVSSFPLTVTDFLDRDVTIAAIPKRIVSLAPRNTEILFALGVGDSLVGVTNYCNYPPEAAEIEQVGGFSGPTISLEKLVALEPDLVITAGNLHEPLIARLEELGLVVLALDGESFDEMYRELEVLGRITGERVAAAELIRSIQERLDGLEARKEKIPFDKRRRVMYLVTDEPLMVAGPKSFIGRLIENCGGENVFADVEQAYPQIGEEAVLARDPEVLLAPSSFDTPAFRERLRNRAGLGELAAIRQDRIVFLSEDLLSRCGPRSAEAQEAVAKAIYPEYFSDSP